MDAEGGGGVQAENPRDHRPKPGHLHVPMLEGTERIHARMDELLPFVGTVPAVAGAGSLDPASREDVSLETVALCQNAGAAAPETGRRETDGDPDGDEPEKLLAVIENAGNADRDDKRVAGEAGTSVAQGNVGVVPLSADTSGLFALID